MTKTLAIDWDGTIEDNAGFLPGAEESLRALLKSGYKIWIHSCRCNFDAGANYIAGRIGELGFQRPLEAGQIELWLGEGKPPADLYIDDKGLRFDGWFDLVPRVRALA